MFQHRIESFFSQYVLSDAHPIGHITDYVIKIEFQMRGSPHAHCLLWVSDAPRIAQDGDEVVCEFIKKYISASPIITDRNIHDINLRRILQNIFMLTTVGETILVDLDIKNLLHVKPS